MPRLKSVRSSVEAFTPTGANATLRRSFASIQTGVLGRLTSQRSIREREAPVSNSGGGSSGAVDRRWRRNDRRWHTRMSRCPPVSGFSWPDWVGLPPSAGANRHKPQMLPLLGPTASAKLLKNLSDSFFAVDWIRRLPSWAILPPTSALAVYAQQRLRAILGPASHRRRPWHVRPRRPCPHR